VVAFSTVSNHFSAVKPVAVVIFVILKSIINATCPGHQEQENLMLSKFPAIFDGENFER